MTTLISSNKSLSAPLSWMPKVPDYSTGLLIDIDPATLPYANNAPATSIVGGGSGSARQRTFDNTAHSVPLFSTAGGAGGAPGLVFNATNTVRNGAPGNMPANVAQPITIAMVVRNTVLPAATGEYQRYYSLGDGDLSSFIQCQPRPEGVSFGTSGGSVTTVNWPNEAAKTADFVSIFVLNGANSRIKAFGQTAVANAAGPPPLRVMALGTTYFNTGEAAGKCLRGVLTRLMIFNRAMSVDDVNGLDAYLTDKYHIV